MPDMSGYTNGELLEIAGHPENELWASALEKLDEYMTAADVKVKKGFENPPPPPNP